MQDGIPRTAPTELELGVGIQLLWLQIAPVQKMVLPAPCFEITGMLLKRCAVVRLAIRGGKRPLQCYRDLERALLLRTWGITSEEDLASPQYRFAEAIRIECFAALVSLRCISKDVSPSSNARLMKGEPARFSIDLPSLWLVVPGRPTIEMVNLKPPLCFQRTHDVSPFRTAHHVDVLILGPLSQGVKSVGFRPHTGGRSQRVGVYSLASK
jgi:hypothetical protein